MPNWCENDLTIHGDKKDLDTIQTLMKSDGSDFDFEQLLPIPEVFMGVREGFITIDGVGYRRWRTVDGVDVGITDEEQIAWQKEYGAAGWYDWCCNNWDTKWNACEAEASREEVFAGCDKLFYSFNTAWSPPVPIIRKLIELFPQCEIVHEYFECGAAFCGGIRHNEGDAADVNTEWSGEYHGHRGG